MIAYYFISVVFHVHSHKEYASMIYTARYSDSERAFNEAKEKIQSGFRAPNYNMQVLAFNKV